jgi:hypothetical protein
VNTTAVRRSSPSSSTHRETTAFAPFSEGEPPRPWYGPGTSRIAVAGGGEPTYFVVGTPSTGSFAASVS